MHTQDSQTNAIIQSLFGGSLPIAQSVEKAEIECLKKEQVDCPVYHRFGPGIYIREVHIPAGTFSIGHYQNKEHLNIMLKGRVTMLLNNGLLEEVIAPAIFASNPGRKIGYIQEDMVWLNVYPTTETDVEKLEETFLTKSDPWKENNDLQNGIAKLHHVADREDYQKVLREFRFSEDTVRTQSENEDDQIPFPYGSWKVMVNPSPIEGKGLFATAVIEPWEIIAPARMAGKRTPAGRYTNHSTTPNAEMRKNENGDIDLVATAKIKGCSGGYAGEEITINYRHALSLSIGARTIN